VQCDIRKHDNRQFEVKVAYPLDRHRRRARYRLEMFIFLPYQIGVDSTTYPREQFYEDLRSYTRFKTPDIPLHRIADPNLSTSPLTRVVGLIEEARGSGRWNQVRMVYELKMLATVLRAGLRDRARHIRYLALSGEDGRREALAAAGRLLRDLEPVLEGLRGMGRELASAPEEVVKTYDLVDEYSSLQVAFVLLGLLRSLRREDRPEAAAEEVMALLAEAVRREAEHRRSRGFPTRVAHDDDRSNEYFLYRESLLKKYCASVLFLSVDQRAGGRPIHHVLQAVAAAVAMTVGVVGLWLAARFFPRNTLALGLAVVLVYAFRDRVKDMAREIGSRLAPRWISDRTGRLVDPQHRNRVGSTRETVRWLTRDELPDDVRQARRYQDALERAVAEPTERIIHYTKHVVVDSRAIFAAHERPGAVDDIIRMHVGHWLGRMDNPRKVLLALRDGSPVPARIRAARVYHVNLVVRLTSGAGGGSSAAAGRAPEFGAGAGMARQENVLRKARLVVSKRGIERIEMD